MKKSIFNICYSADNNYVEQLGVSIASILKSSAEDESFNFFILTAGIDGENRKKLEELKKIKDFNIKYISVNPDEFKNCKLLNQTDKEMSHYHVTLPTYFRYKIGSLLKDISKVLYLDCDIIIKKSLKPLFETDLGNNFFGMVKDAESEKEAKRLGLKNYFNAGVMLINLDLWRKENLEEKLFKYSKENIDKILWQDQDVINLVCSERIKELKNEWNFQFFLYDFMDYQGLVKELKDASILHFAGRFKPWIEPFEHPVLEEYYYYLGFTPWANKIREYKYACFGKYLEGNVGGNNKFVITKEELLEKGIKPIYSMIDEAYDFTKKSLSAQEKAFDQKINGVYSEITNSYEFTKSEITNNYEFTKSEINKKAQETNDLIEVQKREIEQKFEEVYSRISEDCELIKKQTKDNQDKINKEMQENISRLEALSSSNFEETKAGLEKLINHINQNNDKLFGIINEYHEKQEKRLVEEIDELKEKVLEKVISSKYEELKNEISSKLNSFEEQELREIKEYTKKEIENSGKMFSEMLEQIKKDFETRERQRQLDFEKQLLDLEMKYKKMQNVLNPLISFMKRFNKPQKPDERKQ